MKILISTDIEGISGVNSRDFLDEESAEYYLGQENLTKLINYVVEICFSSGAEKVIVADGHGSGRNILLESVDKRAIVHYGKPGKYSMVEGAQEADYCIFLGYHGMANKGQSYCAHTNSTKNISSVKINGVEVGEGQINLLTVTDFSCKLLLFHGTDVAVQEMDEFFFGIPCVVSKRSVAQYVAESRSPGEIFSEVKEKLSLAFKERGCLPSPKVSQKYSFEVEVPYAFLLEEINTTVFEKKSNRKVGFESSSMKEAYLTYRSLLKHLSKKEREMLF